MGQREKRSCEAPFDISFEQRGAAIAGYILQAVCTFWSGHLIDEILLVTRPTEVTVRADSLCPVSELKTFHSLRQ